MNHIVKVVQDLKPPLLMVLVQIAYAGNTVIASLAITDGINIRVFSAYRLIFGAVITIILALIFESYEKLNLQTAAGKAKVMGTVIGVIGSMLLSFFKGLKINIWKNIHINLMDKRDNNQMRAYDGKEWIGVLSGMDVALVFQYGSSFRYMLPFFFYIYTCYIYPVQATVFALCVEKDWNQWKLPSAIRILAALYSGIVVTAFVNIVTAWCVHKRGPLYASLFNPLSLVLVAPTASFLLQEKLYLGRILGATLIVCGLYMVLWGKSKDMKPPADLVSSETESSTTELVVVSANNNSHHVSNNQVNSKRNIVTGSLRNGDHQMNDIDNNRSKESK
ncbi:hypothetical protein V8G54_001054 [Vigna mungo]|uniref:WAT1-related protein n=1 Tax=Vigna mungo TaxID=3915 RepID=A0AAQ3P7I6_VIGMU